MHRFFAPLVAPLVDAIEPAAVAETGAGSGRLTRKLLETLPPTTRIHAIDPAPALDPGLVDSEAARLSVHPRRGIAALGEIGPVDLALLDGDPNWYSVSSEIEILTTAARQARRPAPLLVVHNVHWPFGRRDGYHDPAAIPEAHRHEHTRLGLLPGRREPSEGGLRLTPYCAVADLEPRSGVFTALDDLVAGSDLNWTLIEIPGFHGCAVLAEEHLLSERPQLAERLDGLEKARFLRSQARRAEGARLDLEVEIAALRGGVLPSAPTATEVTETESAAEEHQREPSGQRPTAGRPAPERALLTEHPDLIAELAEQRARREALEWQLQRVEEDLSGRDARLEALTGERDSERRSLIEVRVRLEAATERLAEEREQVTALRERVKGMEGRERALERELQDVVERENLVAGRLSHREDALQAADAEMRALRADLETMRSDLAAGRDALEEVLRRIEAISETRWARFGRGVRRMTRAVGVGRGSEDPFEGVSAAARSALPPPRAHEVDDARVQDDVERLEADIERRV